MMTATPISHPAYIPTREKNTNDLLQSLLAGGQAPQPVTVDGHWPVFGARAWADACSFARLRNPGAPGGALKRLSAATRHAAVARELRRRGIDVFYAWRGILGRHGLALLAARSAGIDCVQFERGPIPAWVQIDMEGVNAGSSIPREPAFFAAWRAGAGRLATPWRSLSDRLASRPTRYGLVRQDERRDWSGEGPFLFCPFQLNLAGAVLPDGGWVSDPADLVRALADASRALPAGWHLRVKPHPAAHGDLAAEIGPYLSDRLRIDRDTNSLDQLGASRGVITVNSAMGLEAFFHDKPVIVLGDSYYSDFGRTEVATSAEALADLIARPDALGFDQGARDDLMDFLFNDFFIPEEAVRSGAFTFETLSDRHARHRAILAGLPKTGAQLGG